MVNNPPWKYRMGDWSGVWGEPPTREEDPYYSAKGWGSHNFGVYDNWWQ